MQDIQLYSAPGLSRGKPPWWGFMSYGACAPGPPWPTLCTASSSQQCFTEKSKRRAMAMEAAGWHASAFEVHALGLEKERSARASGSCMLQASGLEILHVLRHV